MFSGECRGGCSFVLCRHALLLRVACLALIRGLINSGITSRALEGPPFSSSNPQTMSINKRVPHKGKSGFQLRGGGGR